MATLYESHNTGDDSAAYIGAGDNWRAQTFTPSVTHTITSVKLLLYKLAGSPGTITVKIRATTAGLPSGSDLVTGITNGNTLTTNSAGEWREITLGAGTSLTAGIMYSYIVTAAAQDGSNVAYTRWRDDGADGYTGGTAEFSSDGGSSWPDEIDTRDLMFEEYGIRKGELAGLYAVVEERFHYVDAYGVERALLGEPV